MKDTVGIHKTLHVRAPVAAVYGLWSRPEEFPRFMGHLRAVELLDDGSYLWRADGPGGRVLEWHAVITENVPNRRIAWSSLKGSHPPIDGCVRFEAVEDGTRLQIDLFYRPPAGLLGHAIARWLGQDPKRAMDDDLLRFQSLLEQGVASGPEGRVRLEALSAS